jgi:hypothetical protein
MKILIEQQGSKQRATFCVIVQKGKTSKSVSGISDKAVMRILRWICKKNFTYQGATFDVASDTVTIVFVGEMVSNVAS